MSEHPFAPYVRILGRGRKAARSLTYDESVAAMSMILEGKVKDVQLGAFLMLLRIKEESHEELAGFAQAARNYFQQSTQALSDFDWPSYAGKQANHPHYIAAMWLLNQAGYSVLCHGARGHTENRLYSEDIFRELGLPVASSLDDAKILLAEKKLVYLPLENFCAPLNQLMHLRNDFGLRSPVHSFAKLMNPGNSKAMIVPTFHPSYKPEHQQAAFLLGEQNLSVFKGDSGEAERRPNAILAIDRIKQGEICSEKWPAMMEINKNTEEKIIPSLKDLIAIWQGKQHNAYSHNAIIGTCALALQTLHPELEQHTCIEKVQQLWQTRDTNLCS